MSAVLSFPKIVARSMGVALAARMGRYRRWPSTTLLLDEPLALTEERTSRLRRIYSHAQRDAWDGPAVFREAVTRHGGIQLSEAFPPEALDLRWRWNCTSLDPGLKLETRRVATPCISKDLGNRSNKLATGSGGAHSKSV
ncbi:MAG TPA: hypothetical protein DEP35_20725 [Deltaproteobacteria bacterium]|jgi:hypothetical protein|nr:hypothetical protein [Deltaproteobacteria bacterium]